MKSFWFVFALAAAATVQACGDGGSSSAGSTASGSNTGAKRDAVEETVVDQVAPETTAPEMDTPKADTPKADTADADAPAEDTAENTAENTADAPPSTVVGGPPSTITGSILFGGKRPDPEPPLKVGAEESEGCLGEVPLEDRSLLISETGGIANVVVSLEAAGFEVEIPEQPIVIDQIACRFEPHVQVVPAGATLEFTNSDGTNHNIHTYAKKNQNKNSNVSGGQALEAKVEYAEEFETKCDIHSWMNAWVVVTDDTHWAVTDGDGTFTLAGVPDGAYKLSLWHETLGKNTTAEVEVADGAAAVIRHEWKAKSIRRAGR